MQRDLDLARKILLAIEQAPTLDERIELDFPDVDEVVITYHVMLLYEAGLIHALDSSDRSGPDFEPLSLTWQGHEFLDAARDDTIWRRARTITVEKVGGVSFDLLKQVLSAIATGYLKSAGILP